MADAPANRARGLALLAVAAVVAAGVTAYLFLSGDDEAPTSPFATATVPGGGGNGETGPLVPNRPTVGEPAPDFALYDARDGTLRRLSDFRGRVVVLNWYASWCGPCKREIPAFNAMLAAVGDEVVVVGVDYQEQAGDALKILDEYEATYPALLDSNADVADHYRVGNRIPSSFVIDAEGILRAQQIGEVDEEDLARHLAQAGVTYVPTGAR